MITSRWLEARRPLWSRLEALLEASRRGGVRSLKVHELRELVLLYRQIAADLSAVREDASGRSLSGFLNQLLGRAHNIVYRSRRTRPFGVLRFYTTTYPRIFRETIAYTLAATMLFVASASIGWAIVSRDPSFQRFVLGGEMADTIERREMWTHSIVGIKPLASSRIATNNVSVCLATAASGILCGAGTVFLLSFNGLLLGVVGASCWRVGMSLSLWSFVAPHGVLELPAIFISGGAGLVLARGLLFPGILPRRDSIARAGALAVRLVAGVFPLLVVAGLLEGFVSPSSLPAPVKLGIGAIGASLLFFYLIRGDRVPLSEGSGSPSRSEDARGRSRS